MAALADFIDRHPRLFVRTGAGCSTDSVIPDYRDANGEWKRGRPVVLQDFLPNGADDLLVLKGTDRCANALSFLL